MEPKLQLATVQDVYQTIQDGVMAFLHSEATPLLSPHEQRVMKLAHEMYNRLLVFIDLGILVNYDPNIGTMGYKSM